MLAARFSVVVHDEVVGRAPIAVAWTDDARLTAAIGAAARSTAANDPALADLPTGPSTRPRHTLADRTPADRTCPICDLQAADGDRFCERCGHELAGPQKS
jgi:hypothetical protein